MECFTFRCLIVGVKDSLACSFSVLVLTVEKEKWVIASGGMAFLCFSVSNKKVACSFPEN